MWSYMCISNSETETLPNPNYMPFNVSAAEEILRKKKNFLYHMEKWKIKKWGGEEYKVVRNFIYPCRIIYTKQ